MDALPVQFPYVEKGIVPVLLAQPTFKWGKVSVEKVVDKIQLKKAVPAVNEMKLIRVHPPLDGPQFHRTQEII